MKILTVCRAGLVRSVALADVLKLHFEPTDVIPVGIDFNEPETISMLCEWADIIVVMQAHYKLRFDQKWQSKICVCDVGPDIYGSSKHKDLIEKVFVWARATQHILKISEHNKVL